MPGWDNSHRVIFHLTIVRTSVIGKTTHGAVAESRVCIADDSGWRNIEELLCHCRSRHNICKDLLSRSKLSVTIEINPSLEEAVCRGDRKLDDRRLTRDERREEFDSVFICKIIFIISLALGEG